MKAQKTIVLEKREYTNASIRNAQVSRKGNEITITLKLSDVGTLSDSGKSWNFGNVSDVLPDGMRVGLNVYKVTPKDMRE